jgi:hypothetical protein
VLGYWVGYCVCIKSRFKTARCILLWNRYWIHVGVCIDSRLASGGSKIGKNGTLGRRVCLN